MNNKSTPQDPTNGGNIQGDDLRQQAERETANAIARMKNGAAVVDGSDISEAIRHIAAATQEPVDLAKLQIAAPDRWHNPRRDTETVLRRIRADIDRDNALKAKTSKGFLNRLRWWVLSWFGH